MVSIHYEDDDLLILNKPRALPSAPLARKKGPTLCEWAFDYCKSIATIKGRMALEGGLLHRLDNDTEGLVLFAKNSVAYNFILYEAQNDGFEKGYLAYCGTSLALLSPTGYSVTKWQKKIDHHSIDGFYYLQSRFIKAQSNSGKVRAITSISTTLKATKIYNTSLNVTPHHGSLKVACHLTNGFRHQIRASLQALGLPIHGDPLYGNTSHGSFKFWATSLSFIHPTTQKREIYQITPKES